MSGSRRAQRHHPGQELATLSALLAVFSLASVAASVAAASTGQPPAAVPEATSAAAPAAPQTYSVMIVETGLSSGKTWGIHYGPYPTTTTHKTTGLSEIILTLQNGTYSFRADNVTGYTVSPTHGTWTVAGAATEVSLKYTPPSTGGGGGRPPIWQGLPYFALLGAGAVVVSIVWIRIRKRGKADRALREANPPQERNG